jgi:uncharacterized repeat protein (TIGR02543 family)
MDGEDLKQTIEPADERIILEGGAAAGDYYYSFRLYKGTDLYGVVSELVQVRGNLYSEKVYTLTLEDLNLTYVITWHLNGGEFELSVDNPGYYRSTEADLILPDPVRSGYDFGGWYDNADFSGETVTEIPQGSTGDKTFYARWYVPEEASPGEKIITLSFSDPGSAAFDQSAFTVIRGGSPASRAITLNGTWDSQEWRVDGRVRETGTGLTINAGDYTVGGHTLEVIVYKGSTPWSRTLGFTVIQPVTGLNLSKTALTLPVRGAETLAASVIPANASDKTVTWTSNNPGVADVGLYTGLVRAYAIGTAVITAASEDGGITASCTVTVEAARPSP